MPTSAAHRTYRTKREKQGHCHAAHESGYTCERRDCDGAPHRGGDHEWVGSHPGNETLNDVHRELLNVLDENKPSTARHIAAITGLSIETVRRKLRALEAEELATPHPPEKPGGAIVWGE